jgi:hypothetical protein
MDEFRRPESRGSDSTQFEMDDVDEYYTAARDLKGNAPAASDSLPAPSSTSPPHILPAKCEDWALGDVIGEGAFAEVRVAVGLDTGRQVRLPGLV